MTKFFNYYNSLCIGSNFPTVFTFDPYYKAIKDLMLTELKQIVYYIEKLKELNQNMSDYTDKVIEFISVLIVNLDFRKESLFTIIEDLYYNKIKLKELYINICNENKINIELLNSNMPELSDENTIIKMLNKLEKNQIDTNEIFQKNRALYEIILNLVLNACNSLIELKEYNVDLTEEKDEVLKLFNTSNFTVNDEKILTDKIKKFSKYSCEIETKLNREIAKKFGPVQVTKVPLLTKAGKCILISGYGFKELEKLLKDTKNLDISIYTHHNMINAFKYKFFAKYKNLTAHYQLSINNFPLDFATFPGPIFISKNSIPQIDVIRGQIYTSAKYPAFGIGKIENNDFTPIIEYAEKSSGFKKDEDFGFIQIGCENSVFQEKINSVINKFKNNLINKILIIGMIDKFEVKDNYIEYLTQNISDDCFIISFSGNINRQNFWNINSYYDFEILYNIVTKLKNNINNAENVINIFLADCNNSTISHIFNLIHLSIKNIYLGPCCPNIINPLIIEGLKNNFNIEELQNPKNELYLKLKKAED